MCKGLKPGKMVMYNTHHKTDRMWEHGKSK